MTRLECLDYWPALLRDKDSLSLRQLCDRYGCSLSALQAALRRTGTTRLSARSGPRPQAAA